MKRRMIALLLAALMLMPLFTAPAMADGSWKKDSTGWWYDLGGGDYLAGEWARIDGVWYYFNANGYMRTGWLLDGGSWYYLLPSGAMAMGWQKIGGEWYYMYGSGAMATNAWVKSGSDWYYMGADGAMVTDTWIEGDWIDENGVWYDVLDVLILEEDEIRRVDGGWMIYAECSEKYYFEDAYVRSLKVGDTVRWTDTRVEYLQLLDRWLLISDMGPYYSFMKDPYTGRWTLRGDNDYAAGYVDWLDWYFIPDSAVLEDEMWKVCYGVDVEIGEPGDFFLVPGETWTLSAVNLYIYRRGNTVERVVHYFTP